MTSEPSPGLAFEESEQSTVAYPESDDDDVDLALELERLGSPACAALAASPLVLSSSVAASPLAEALALAAAGRRSAS